jgi:hypothetical protein
MPGKDPVSMPRQNPTPNQEPPEKKKKKLWLIPVILVAVLAVLAAALILLKVFVLDAADSGGDDEDGWVDMDTTEDEEKEEKTSEEDLKQDDTEQETDAQEPLTATELLQEQLQKSCQELGDARGSAYDVKSLNSENSDRYGSVGVIGSYIQDVSGDGVEDLILVYATDDFAGVYADVYTVEDDQVTCKADHLWLWDDEGAGGYTSDDSVCISYMKQVGNSWYLYGDAASNFHHFADGASGSLMVYDCSGHSYTEIQNYSYAGSDFGDEVYEIPDAGRLAGLNVDNDMTIGAPYGFSDRDVTLIAGYGLTVDESYDFSDRMQGIYDGSVYGSLAVARLTDAQGNADSAAANSFYVQYASQGWVDSYNMNAGFEDGSILPDSSTRPLTDSDLADIKDDADLLQLARNEIYARHGRIFTTQKLIDYFESTDWYEPRIEPDDFSDDMLSQIEKDNIKLIQKYEELLN